MHQSQTLRLSSWARLVGLALLLGVGVLASLGLATRTAHAQPGATIIVSTCDEPSLESAISNAASGDTITFGCSGRIILTQTLVISKNLTLDGSGQTVALDGGKSVRVLVVNSGVSFTLNAFIIVHGSIPFGGSGSGLLNNGGTVTISNSFVAANSTEPGSGGGLYNAGGTVTISNSTFIANSSSIGGGLYNAGGTVAISNSTFDRNDGKKGGGLYNAGGTMTISNSTFARNSASFGGGLSIDSGTVTISNSTFAYNSFAGSGGGLLINGGTLNIGGSIVANNAGGNCYGSALTDQGYNLDSDGSCGFISTGDLQNTNPQLDPNELQSNGGPTQTIALLSGSPAIDHMPAMSCPATDQRGMTRPDDNETSCDMGAYESNYPSDSDLALTNMPADITTDATSPQGASVSYTLPTVVDEDSPLPSATCSPTSGSTFAIGTTTVTCTVSDSDDVNSPVSGSFQVVVVGASDQVSALISLVNSFHLSPPGIQTSFDSQLQAVLADLAGNNMAQACSDLASFINHAHAQSGKHLTVDQANQMIAAAQQIQVVLGC